MGREGGSIGVKGKEHYNGRQEVILGSEGGGGASRQ